MKRLLIFSTLFAVAGWCLYAAAGHALANSLGTRYAGAITRIGEGKIVSPSDFIHMRLFEAAWLGTLLLAWVLMHGAVSHWLATRSSRRFAWVTHSLLAFVCLNLWLAQATGTALFWGTMWQGGRTHNLTRFHLKLILAREEPAAASAVLVGSSQTRAQIDEGLLNSLLGNRLRTTELHYPGSRAYDVWLVQPVISRARPDYLVCYLSEAYFYGASVTEVVPNFLTAGAWPDLVRRGGLKYIPADRIGYGLLGHALPVFRLREVLAQRLLGPGTTEMKQTAYDRELRANLAVRSEEPAKLYAINDESRFHQRALEDLVVRAGRSGQQVILLAGQLNPLFERQLQPAIRADMLACLRELATNHANVTLIENLPPQTEQDYEDLTHVTREMQARFTGFFAAWMEEHLARENRRAR